MALGPFQQSSYGRDFVSDYSRDQARAQTNDFMWGVYRWMSIGLALTGAIAWFVANTPVVRDAVLGNPILFYGCLIAEFGMVIAFSAMAHRVSTQTAAAMFLGYSALTGVTFSTLFTIYTHASIASTFFVTAASFGGLSAYGAVTKRDLSGAGRFAFMGLIGVVVGSIVNIFVASTMLQWMITYAGVLVFTILTAYDTQKLRAMYEHAGASDNLALRGALTLYLDFINLFLLLLRLLGDRRE